MLCVTSDVNCYRIIIYLRHQIDRGIVTPCWKGENARFGRDTHRTRCRYVY